jgi:hypothetical protein
MQGATLSRNGTGADSLFEVLEAPGRQPRRRVKEPARGDNLPVKRSLSQTAQTGCHATIAGKLSGSGRLSRV